MGPLTKYLLRLAQDPKFAERHAKSKEDAIRQMTEQGLSEEQQDLLLTGDATKISEAVAEEFPKGLPGNPLRLTLTCMIVKHVTD